MPLPVVKKNTILELTDSFVNTIFDTSHDQNSCVYYNNVTPSLTNLILIYFHRIFGQIQLCQKKSFACQNICSLDKPRPLTENDCILIVLIPVLHN
jgi:hypothetical protein